MVELIGKPKRNASNKLKEGAIEAAAALEQQYERMADKKDAIINAAENKFYEMGAQSRDLVNKGEEQVKQYCNTLENQVRSYPLLSLGAAVLVGVLLSRLLGGNK